MMPAGKYLIMVSPIWNQYADESPEYKKVFLQVMCDRTVSLKHLTSEDGQVVFTESLKKHAQDQPANTRRGVPMIKEAYKQITLEAGELWYGYIYCNNPSRRPFKEIITPKLVGLEIVGKEMVNGKVELNVGARSDDIIILRRTDPAVEFGMSLSLIHI